MRKSDLTRRPQNSTKTDSFQLKGGINEITSPLSLDPGELYGVSNYEPGETNGYRRIDGYERLDGRQSPSDASYWILYFRVGTIPEPEIGSMAFCRADNSKAEVGAIIVESGSWAGGDAAGYLVLFRLDGFFEVKAYLQQLKHQFTPLMSAFLTGLDNYG